MYAILSNNELYVILNLGTTYRNVFIVTVYIYIYIYINVYGTIFVKYVQKIQLELGLVCEMYNFSSIFF
jgi:hypothetical protein